MAVDAEGDHVAGPDADDVGERPFDVLREHVAAADDDHVLDATAHDHLAVEQVGEVAGAQPAVVEQLGVRVRALVVPGGDRGTADLELTDLPVLELVARDRIDDPDLQAEDRSSQDGERVARRAPSASTGSGVALRLEHAQVDGIGAEARHRLREGAGDGHLGHAEGREHRTRPEAVGLPGVDELAHRGRIDRLGTVERDPEPRQVEAVAAAQGSGRQHVREVRTRRRGASVGGDPLHPAAGAAHEVGRGTQHEWGAGGDREGEEPHQPHVVVQREPRHEDVVVRVERRGVGDGIEVGADGAVRQHHALRVRGGPAGELQDRRDDRGRRPGAATPRRQADRGRAARRRSPASEGRPPRAR